MFTQRRVLIIIDLGILLLKCGTKFGGFSTEEEYCNLTGIYPYHYNHKKEKKCHRQIC